MNKVTNTTDQDPTITLLDIIGSPSMGIERMAAPYLIVLLLILAIPVGAIFIVMHFIVKFW